jgi:restriction system protein
MWEIEVRHEGLNRYRNIRGSDRWVVEQRAAALQAQWDDLWARQENRNRLKNLFFFGKAEAEAATALAEGALNALRDILPAQVAKNHVVDWAALKRHDQFPDAAPQAVTEAPLPEKPQPPLPQQPKIGFPEKVLPLLRRAAIAQAANFNAAASENFADDLAQWQSKRAEVEDLNRKKHAYYNAKLRAWEEAKSAFDAERASYNSRLDQVAAGVREHDPESVAALVSVALARAKLPEPFGTDFEVYYSASEGACVVDYILPSPEEMPTVREVRFVQSRNELIEKYISDTERSRMYDHALYGAAISVAYIAIACDSMKLINRVTINGWVDFVHKATGLDERACILSFGLNRADVDRIDFQRVDPKECFKSLKGVAASKLVGLAPVAPLEQPRIPDSRFIASQEVASKIESGVNIATMGRQEFEHLVREVFENEFSSEGTEIRVTQASRDGGVDAVVFDPHPIRGGKIVIQAKRYTNTVDVSSVRDLYGTVMNEGASKGILVTTSQFGPDARKFAQGKPITLIDGGNFLHLLEKMGVQARINLQEAKAALAAGR